MLNFIKNSYGNILHGFSGSESHGENVQKSIQYWWTDDNEVTWSETKRGHDGDFRKDEVWREHRKGFSSELWNGNKENLTEQVHTWELRSVTKHLSITRWTNISPYRVSVYLLRVRLIDKSTDSQWRTEGVDSRLQPCEFELIRAEHIVRVHIPVPLPLESITVSC